MNDKIIESAEEKRRKAMSDNEETFMSMAEARRVAYGRKQIIDKLKKENAELRAKLEAMPNQKNDDTKLMVYEDALKHIKFFVGEWAANRIDASTLAAKVNIEVLLALPKEPALIANKE